MPLLALLIATTYLLLAPRLYTSTAELYYQRNSPQLLNDSPSRSGEVGEKYLATEAKVLGSSAVLAVALDQLDSMGLADWSDEDPLKALQEDLMVDPGRKDDILTVSFAAPTPQQAQAIVKSVVEAYQTFQKSKRQQSLDGLREQRDKILADLRAKSAQIIEFQQNNAALSFDSDGTNSTTQRLNSLAEAVTAAQLDAINVKAAYEEAAAILANDPELLKRVESMQRSGMSVSAGDQATLRTELFNVQQRLAEARRQYMSGHPLLQTIQSRVDELSVAYVAAARERWLSAERRHADLERSYDEQKKLALTMQSKRQEYAQLTDELKDLQKLAADMANQYNKLTVLESVGQLNITVLEEASLPDKPSSPLWPRVLVIAMALGLVSGLGMAFLAEWRDQSLRTAEEVKQTVGVPVLGVVPAMRRDLPQNQRGKIVHDDTSGDVAEAYRTVRTAVYFGLPDDNSRTLLISSPSEGDGKSTLVSNLAIAMAQAGRRVLVVDADLRLPTQHRIFGVDSGPGLSSVLQGDVDAEDAILPTGIDRLDLLPCGPIPDNPSEILNSQNFSDLLGDLACRYDHILLDAPALMGVADARIVAAWCDATVLVLHAEKSNRRLAELARDGLLAVGANLVGVVVNAAARNDGQHGFFADFGYGPEKSRTGSEAPTPPQRTGRRSSLFAPPTPWSGSESPQAKIQPEAATSHLDDDEDEGDYSTVAPAKTNVKTASWSQSFKEQAADDFIAAGSIALPEIELDPPANVSEPSAPVQSPASVQKADADDELTRTDDRANSDDDQESPELIESGGDVAVDQPHSTPELTLATTQAGSPDVEDAMAEDAAVAIDRQEIQDVEEAEQPLPEVVENDDDDDSSDAVNDSEAVEAVADDDAVDGKMADGVVADDNVAYQPVAEPGDASQAQDSTDPDDPIGPPPPPPKPREPTMQEKLAETSAKLRASFESLRSARER